MRQHDEQAAHAARVQPARQSQQLARLGLDEGLVAAVAVACALEDDEGKLGRERPRRVVESAAAGNASKPRTAELSGPATRAATRWKRPPTSASASSADPSVPPAPTTSAVCRRSSGWAAGRAAPRSACSTVSMLEARIVGPHLGRRG
ncbi:MAG: hypothetical protein ABT20_09115 [Rubrivivax sp. SCN 70-15]|nr:MAG: hypothetical protein ABT20_09115 [Rubrivivax sp. SCN 70-15]